MSKPLWTLSEIAAATGGTASGDAEITGISIDTRSLQKGELFVALKDVRDGHDFVGNAFGAGAGGAFVSRPVEGGPMVQVDDVLQGLERLGVAARERAASACRVGVTGSVGKTSVKEMLAQIFRGLGPAHWNEKSFNNQWGVPLTLARMPAETERAVFEIGMSTPGEIAPRSHMVAPHAAIVTKIAPAHLEGLGSVEGIAQEKSDLFVGLVEKGAAILPLEDDFFDVLAGRAKQLVPSVNIRTFGRGESADARIAGHDSDGVTTRVDLVIHSEPVSVTLNAVGAHWADNAAAALLAACPNAGDDVQAAADKLNGYTPPAGRGTQEILALPTGGEIVLVDDAYNANPESMRAALAAFAERPCAGRRVAALGEMLEIGADAGAAHAGLAEPLLASGAEMVFLAGAGMEPLVDKLEERIRTVWDVKANALDAHIKTFLKDGDLLLLKGSNASGMGLLANRLRTWSRDGASALVRQGAESVVRGENAV